MSQGRKEPVEPSLFTYLDEDRLYAHIPKRHFYEQLGQLLDLSFVYELTAPLYADRLGRPSLDPVVFFKALLVGFFENITYDTELEYRLADSLTLRRFLGYGLDERTPDESTLRKTRQRMPEEVFRAVFDYVLALCHQQGLVRGRAIGTDTTLVDANASMDSLVHRELGCTYEQYVLALRRQDQPEAGKAEAKAADRQRPGKASNEVWESATDRDARVMVHADKHTALSYRLDATVDLETGVVVAAGADLADQSDQQTCLQRVDEAVESLAELGLAPRVVVADQGHHCGENLAGLEQRGLVSLVTPRPPQGRAGFRREDFEYQSESNTYVCPAGQSLVYVGTSGDRRRYRAQGRACRSCAHFGVCTTEQRGRMLTVSLHAPLLEANRARAHNETLRPLRMIRRQRGEGPFGYFKQFGGLARVSGRGLDHAQKKALVAAFGWNLLLLVKRAAGRPTEGLVRALVRLFGGCRERWLTRTGHGMPRPDQRAWTGRRRHCEAALSGGC